MPQTWGKVLSFEPPSWWTAYVFFRLCSIALIPLWTLGRHGRNKLDVNCQAIIDYLSPIRIQDSASFSTSWMSTTIEHICGLKQTYKKRRVEWAFEAWSYSTVGAVVLLKQALEKSNWSMCRCACARIHANFSFWCRLFRRLFPSRRVDIDWRQNCFLWSCQFLFALNVKALQIHFWVKNLGTFSSPVFAYISQL